MPHRLLSLSPAALAASSQIELPSPMPEKSVTRKRVMCQRGLEDKNLKIVCILKRNGVLPPVHPSDKVGGKASTFSDAFPGSAQYSLYGSPEKC